MYDEHARETQVVLVWMLDATDLAEYFWSAAYEPDELEKTERVQHVDGTYGPGLARAYEQRICGHEKQ